MIFGDAIAVVYFKVGGDVCLGKEAQLDLNPQDIWPVR